VVGEGVDAGLVPPKVEGRARDGDVVEPAEAMCVNIVARLFERGDAGAADVDAPAPRGRISTQELST